MALERIPTRQKIVNTALELFARQGITETTTRQIADHAEVNEVTLFRHFGNKHGLLLAVLQEFLQEYLLATQLGESLIPSEFKSTVDLSQFLFHYMRSSLQALESVPELMRSLVGEAGQYPKESRHALAQGITEINRAIAAALQEADNHLYQIEEALSLSKIINACILGYTIMVLTSDVELIWSSKEEFIASLIKILVPTSISTPIHRETNKEADREIANLKIQDIPEIEVRNIILQAKRQGLRDYAIAYVLFGAGLNPNELVNLNQTDYLVNKAGVLKIQERLVPLNQKIFGHRYGSAINNPLTNYLKSRKDKHPKMFLSNTFQPLTTSELAQLWQSWHNLDITIEQTQHTWRIEMLMRGIDHENFLIISGLNRHEISAYDLKVKKYQALQQAIALDKST